MTKLAPKRVDKRKDSDRKSRKLTVRMPPETLDRLEQMAKRRGVKRVVVLCELIEEGSKK